MQARFYRNIGVTSLEPGHWVETDKGILVVDSVTLFADRIEINGLPTHRNEGRRVVATMPRTDIVQIVADPEGQAELLMGLTDEPVVGVATNDDDGTPMLSFLAARAEHEDVTRAIGDGWTLEVTL